MNAAIILPILISFAISAALGPVVIPLLRRLKFGQTERDDGPKSHLKKTGTPTMGGLMILAGVILTSLIYVKDYPRIVPVLFVTAGFGIIGFLDDYIKIMLHRSEGLTPPQKMLGQFLVTGIFVFYLYNLKGGDMAMLIPFWPGHYLHLGWLAVPVAFLAIIGTVNGANFTDGLDGLASSVTLLIATFFSVVAVGTQSGLHPITCDPERPAPDHLRGGGKPYGLSAVQCLSGQRLHGRYGLPGPGRLCGGHGLYDGYADFHPDRGPDLLGGDSLRDDSGDVFQAQRREADLPHGAHPSSF